MKAKQQKYLYYGIIVASILIIAFSVYYQLGGLKDFKVKAYEGISYDLAGVDFKGSVSDRRIEELYNQARELIASGQIKGILALIDYRDEDMGKDEAHYFIGIILLNRITELPPEYRVKKIDARGMLSVTLDVHPLVRPSKEKVEAKIAGEAQRAGLELHQYFLEKHFADDQVVIEAFVY